MSKLSTASSKFVQEAHIELDDEDYIVLRELTEKEMLSLSADEGSKNVEVLGKLMPLCMIDHSFETDDGEKAATADVVAMLKKSGSKYMEIVTAWMNLIPLSKKSGEK